MIRYGTGERFMSSLRDKQARAEMKGIVGIILIVSLLTASGCTKTVRVSPSELREEEGEIRGPYVIATEDGKSYDVKSFTISDSLLTIRSLQDEKLMGEGLPIRLDTGDVISIEKRGVSWTGYLLVAGFIGTVAYLWAVAYILGALGQSM